MKGDECTTDACMRVSNRSANLYAVKATLRTGPPLGDVSWSAEPSQELRSQREAHLARAQSPASPPYTIWLIGVLLQYCLLSRQHGRLHRARPPMKVRSPWPWRRKMAMGSRAGMRAAAAAAIVTGRGQG